MATLEQRFLDRAFSVPEKQTQSMQYDAYRLAQLIVRTVPDGEMQRDAVNLLEMALEFAVDGIAEGGVR